MKRRHSLFLLLVCGLGLTLVVACVAAALPTPVEFDSARTARLREAQWDRLDAQADEAAERRRIGGVYNSLGRRLTVVRPDIEKPVWEHWHRTGWPLIAFEGCETITLTQNVPGKSTYTREIGFMVPVGRSLIAHAFQTATGAQAQAPLIMRPVALNPPPMRLVPLRPVWGGLALNTTFYAVLAIMLNLARRRVVGFVRRLRGRCRHCGYDLCGTDHAACPECGTPLTARQTASHA